MAMMMISSLILQSFRLLYFMLFLLLISTLIEIAVSQPAANNCILDMNLSSNPQLHSPHLGDWGGFLHQESCKKVFDKYLFALSQRANLTGRIFSNSDEQRDCLMLMGISDNNVFACGVEELTSGQGGCSDFSVSEVEDRLGDELWSLKENCKNLSADGESNQSCGSCIRSWRGISGLSNDDKHTEIDADVCRFAVLVSLTGRRIGDEAWIQSVHICLESQKTTNSNDRETETSRAKLSLGTWTIIVGVVIGVAALAAIAILIMMRRRSPIKAAEPIRVVSRHSAIPATPDHLKISMKDVCAATNFLSETNLIGEGTAGKVYKGKLSTNRQVAVKHIENDGSVETFVREITSLSHVRHPNLVALLGCCEEEEDFFLVYELCPNGNLSDWLFRKDKVLSWMQRLQIATDCARGLLFLHTYSEGCIVHRDIKPTNILLVENFRAKLSDFGLSKIIDQGESVSSEVRGTFGYMDPEYQSNHHVNSSGDVYSFGIVLLQILSGKRVVNMNMKAPVLLAKMAKTLARSGSIIGFADPKMDGQYSAEAFELTLKLALSCTASKQERPSMQNVMDQLEKAVDISTNSDSTAPPIHSDRCSATSYTKYYEMLK